MKRRLDKSINYLSSLYYGVAAMLLLVVISCSNEKADPKVLIDTDIAFSKMASEKGVGQAFIAYADSSAVILQEKQHPIKGITEVIKAYGTFPEHTDLSWHPTKAEIAASGDLGYTLGEYQLTVNDSTNRKSYGYYVTIWKKQKDGTWKYVLDTGSQKPVD